MIGTSGAVRERELMVKRIFVVDDEKGIADTLVVILRQRGYEASAFYDAQTALEQAERSCPELVISDVVMPGMNGLDMAALMEERHPACKILLVSGNVGTLDLLELSRRNGHDFEMLAKPIYPGELLDRIASVQ
jgi:DNA-binding NtrC family response regulator